MLARLSGLLFAAFLVVPASAQTTVTIKAVEHAWLGPQITDDGGLSLYLFGEDRRKGDGGQTSESACVGDCLVLWPPVPGNPLPLAGAGVDDRLIGAFRRPDGKVQATYNGWPLYYFAEDLIAGDVNGQGFEEFGGEWYLVTPDGEAVGLRLVAGASAHQGGEDCDCHGVAGRPEPAGVVHGQRASYLSGM